jgi:hypothetical protein
MLIKFKSAQYCIIQLCKVAMGNGNFGSSRQRKKLCQVEITCVKHFVIFLQNHHINSLHIFQICSNFGEDSEYA